MAQSAEFDLKKPPAYNYDFFVVGVNILLTGLLGVPPTNGLIPQAPLHVSALSSKKVVVDEDTGLKRVVVEGVCEQRLSNLVHAVLIGLCCFIPGVLPGLKQIPLSVLDGIFLFMGFGCFGGNGFIGRLLLAVTDPLKRASALGTSKELEGVLATPEGRTEVHRCLFDPAVDWG